MNHKTSIKLDFKTWLFLYITKAREVEHIPVEEKIPRKTMDVVGSDPNEVYLFKNYNEYKNFFYMYLNEVNDKLINLAICAKGSKGQIIAFKGLCEQIIVRKQIENFYNSITKKQIDEIHAKGKLTPMEAVQQWESFDLCIKGNKTASNKSRCKYFDYNCHECLMETASHQLEHDKIDFEPIFRKEMRLAKKLTSSKL